MLTARYQEPPAMVRAVVTPAVVRSMYGIGECCVRGGVRDWDSTIWAVVRRR